MLARAAVLLALTFFACGDDPPAGQGARDAAPARDAAMPDARRPTPDARVLPDAGRVPDAPVRPDAMPTPDAPRAPDGSGVTCTFNTDCPPTERCSCDLQAGCRCQAGPRGAGVSGIDTCQTGDDCASSLCVEGPGNVFYCSGPCATEADCGPALPRCVTVPTIGRICARVPGS